MTAHREGNPAKQQMHIVERTEILVRGFARAGITSLRAVPTG
jgi:hypothetical protein